MVNTAQSRNHYDDGTDWISFTANAGYQYTITTINLGFVSNTTLELYDSNQIWLTYNDDYSGAQPVWNADSMDSTD